VAQPEIATNENLLISQIGENQLPNVAEDLLIEESDHLRCLRPPLRALPCLSPRG